MTLRRLRDLPNSVGHALRVIQYVFCFGLLGLVWSLPVMRDRRRRRAGVCTKCKRHQRLVNVLVACLTVLFLLGSLIRAHAATIPQITCHSHITPDGNVQAEPLLQVSPPSGWNVARKVLVAPASGLAILVGRALGMESCAGPPLLVMFWEPPRTSGGGTEIGDTFIAWIPPDRPASGPLSTDGYGLAGEQRYLRYGPNMSQTRVNEAEIAIHESRHVDQWAAGTVLAGPLAFGIAYVLDGALFPSSRNHFERLAGLSYGGYEPAPDGWPAPLWPATIGIASAGVLIWRRRIRWASRVLFAGRNHARAHEPERCPVHTKGWTRASL
jgi:hypothetical protein